MFSYSLTRWLFLRCLGVIYLIAFLSLWPQIPGLIGRNGLAPAARLLQAVHHNFGADAYWAIPTLAWLSGSDRFILLLAAAGCLLALLVILGVLTGPGLLGCWACYLSLVSVGGDFTSFQWDILLLEAGFLAVFLAPWRLLEPHWKIPAPNGFKAGAPKPEPIGNPRYRQPPRWIRDWLGRDLAATPGMVWLVRWLLFRLVLSSGLVKIESGDPTWRNLTALDFHYFTQPLPTPVAWYMAKLPPRIEKASCLFMFAVELGAPFLIFAPRRLRLVGAGLLATLQVLIALTGNYTFFNLLTLTLCLSLIDDALLQRILPQRLTARIAAQQPARPMPAVLRRLAVVLGLVLGFFGLLQIPGMGRWRADLPAPAARVLAWTEPFHLVSNYGLFAVMTTSRLEIIVQGSDDGQKWLDYEFKYKPGDLRRAPPWVAPYHPRLDWQMWFAALGSAQSNPWFVNLMVRLLEGSPEALSLLERNPFPLRPPLYMRALLYDYRFTSFAERRQTGNWWKRTPSGDYFPIASLKATASAQ